MRRHQQFFATTIAGLGLLVAACGGPASSSVATTSPTAVVVSTPAATTSLSTSTPSASSAATTTPVPALAAVPTNSSAAVAANPTPSAASPVTTAATTRYAIVSNGTKADYRVREQLVRLSAPSDAVGTTTAVTGDIVIGADGKVDSAQSKLVVDLTSLQSDSGMRDRFVQSNTLDVAQYPTATFVPTAIQGLTNPLAASGQQTFQLIGNLTIHGVTKPATFSVTTQANESTVTGQATTDFKFEDFGMSPPRAGAVLSVVDDVKLEVTLNLARSA